MKRPLAPLLPSQGRRRPLHLCPPGRPPFPWASSSSPAGPWSLSLTPHRISWCSILTSCMSTGSALRYGLVLHHIKRIFRTILDYLDFLDPACIPFSALYHEIGLG